MFKTHTCGELRAEHIGESVTLAGWVHRRRDHGGMILSTCATARASCRWCRPRRRRGPWSPDCAPEFVLQVVGTVRRPAGGDGEPAPGHRRGRGRGAAEVLNAAKTPPFPIDEDVVDENVRLKYRYLDLRRDRMQRNLILRHR